MHKDLQQHSLKWIKIHQLEAAFSSLLSIEKINVADSSKQIINTSQRVLR
jgi:hypothetical protein